MLQELVFHHLSKNKKRYFILGSSSYRIGKALDNDMVLLDSDASPYLGTLEKKGSSYVFWQNGTSFDLNQEALKTQGYVLSILNHQRWILALAFAGIFSLALMFFQWMGVPGDLASGPVQLPARGTYGNIDSRSISSLEFEFQSEKNKYLILHYTSGNLASSTDLQIQINGQFFSYAPASPGLWNIEQTNYIPVGLLKIGKNIINFTFVGKALAPWALRDIYIEEMDEQPFQQSGMEMIKTAQKLFRERGARKGNLVRAQQALMQAQQSFKRENKIEPDELKEVLFKVESEKKQLIQAHKLLIQKYRRQGEMKKASKVYLKLLNELIDPMDPDRREIELEQRSQG